MKNGIAGLMAQAVEHLPLKCKALSSNSSTSKKFKKEFPKLSASYIFFYFFEKITYCRGEK
jgi:hypothetical protein